MVTSFPSSKSARSMSAVVLIAVSAVLPLHAAQLNIGASASIDADVHINDGAIPTDINTSTGLVTALSGTVDSAVNDATATQTDNVFTQIGTFADPPVPYITTRFDETALSGGDAARGFYYIESTISPDVGSGTEVASVERVLNGTATLDFTDLNTDASASGNYEFGRYLTPENTSTTTAYVISISTGFDVFLAASADAIGSQSVAEAVFSVSFISSGNVQLNGGTPIGASTLIDATDLGTAVVDNLVTSNALFDGVLYEAGVSAVGTGAPTEASLAAESQFLFTIQMAPGSSLGMIFYQSFSTQTSFVPSPGTVLVLMAGIGALGIGRRGRRRIRAR